MKPITTSMYRPRLLDDVIPDLLSEHPALMIVGPRASGKTTTAQRYAASTVRLDHEPTARVFRLDAGAALRQLAEPILLDEWQVVPEVLGAVKRAVDADPRPGRFIVCGSARVDLDLPSWPGTGRVIRLPMYGMTVSERLGVTHPRSLLDRIARGDIPSTAATTTIDLRDYVELALTSGFPQPALRLSADGRLRWLHSYIDQVVTRDVDIDPGRDPVRLRRYLEALAMNTAGVVDERTLHEAAQINRATAQAYERLFVGLSLLDIVPAWTSNRLNRLTRMPKRHLVDPALLVGILGTDVPTVLLDGDLVGRVIESFVVSELRSVNSLAPLPARLFHLREQQGRREIDLLAELPGGRVVAVEIKAGASPDDGDVRHLIWLRNELGDRFAGGAVLHSGPFTYELAAKIHAIPISSLWS